MAILTQSYQVFWLSFSSIFYWLDMVGVEIIRVLLDSASLTSVFVSLVDFFLYLDGNGHTGANRKQSDIVI